MGVARYTSPNPRRPKKATTISSALPDGANSSLVAAPPCFSPRIAGGKPQELVPVGLSATRTEPIFRIMSGKPTGRAKSQKIWACILSPLKGLGGGAGSLRPRCAIRDSG